MELGATSFGKRRSGRLIMHVNKVHHVAEQLGEDQDWLWDVANEMETEDGVIWVHGIAEDGVLAFTDFGIENLKDFVRMHKDNPDLQRHPE